MTAGRDSFPRSGNYRTGREGVKPVALAPIVDGLSHRWRFGDKSVGTGNSGDERRRSRSNWFAGAQFLATVARVSHKGETIDRNEAW